MDAYLNQEVIEKQLFNLDGVTEDYNNSAQKLK